MDSALSRTNILDQLEHYYASFYDITLPTDNSTDNSAALPLHMEAACHILNSQYILTKKAVMWESNCDEYVYVFNISSLTLELYNSCIDYVYQNGMQKITPKKGHMYTYLTAVFICDSCDKATLKKLKSCRIYKSFRFSLYGWMDFHTAMISCCDGKTAVNSSGKANAKLMKNIVKLLKSKGEKEND